jgi:hypothetical protein
MLFKVSAQVRKVFALVLVAAFVATTLSLSTGVASANSGGNGEATFTKWVTAMPGVGVIADMAGVVGGNVGAGTFKGEVLTWTEDATTIHIGALYHVTGGNHSFTADLQVMEDKATGNAKFTGVVTEGWLTGANVTGGFRTISCDQGVEVPQVCYKGTIHIDAASAD